MLRPQREPELRRQSAPRLQTEREARLPAAARAPDPGFSGMMFPSRGLRLKTTHSLRRYCVALLMSGLIVPGTLSAFESDVHFGLTEWLALQAGFVPREA